MPTGTTYTGSLSSVEGTRRWSTGDASFRGHEMASPRLAPSAYAGWQGLPAQVRGEAGMDDDDGIASHCPHRPCPLRLCHSRLRGLFDIPDRQVVNRTRLTVRWLAMTSVKRSQIGGTHYKDVAIQPFEYIHKNNICYLEGTIKYVSRWRTRGGIQDLEKAVHA